MNVRSSLTNRIKVHARELGFEPVGVAPASPPEHWPFYLKWIDQGFAGEMGYLRRNHARRCDPKSILPRAKSILCVGMSYNHPQGPNRNGSGLRGRIAKYARGEDYHDVMKTRLFRLLDFIKTEGGPDLEGRVYVDTGPVLERDAAARAGVGWFGKNTCLIDKRVGSWLLLGEIILDVQLEYDAPVSDHCGTCTRCIDACPTGALPEPYVLDSRKCISYLTIEVKEDIPAEMRPVLGDWIFGCDICQDVCPWNHEAATTNEPAFAPRNGLEAPQLTDLLGMDQAAFSGKFKGSPVKRAKRKGFLRNTAVALGNSGDRRAVPALVEALKDTEPVVRSHSAWALGRLGGEAAREALKEAMGWEADEGVLVEIESALKKLRIAEPGLGVKSPHRTRDLWS